MFISRVSTTLALTAALFTATHLAAADVSDKADPAAPVINSVCPMDGKPIDISHCSMMNMTIGDGAHARTYRMAMCNDTCMTEFQKDPAAALKPIFGKGAPSPKTQFK
jgi:hypothetical protein